jgi:hypothetical protein
MTPHEGALRRLDDGVADTLVGDNTIVQWSRDYACETIAMCDADSSMGRSSSLEPLPAVAATSGELRSANGLERDPPDGCNH